jgi:hypothetical protein
LKTLFPIDVMSAASEREKRKSAQPKAATKRTKRIMNFATEFGTMLKTELAAQGRLHQRGEHPDSFDGVFTEGTSLFLAAYREVVSAPAGVKFLDVLERQDCYSDLTLSGYGVACALAACHLATGSTAEQLAEAISELKDHDPCALWADIDAMAVETGNHCDFTELQLALLDGMTRKRNKAEATSAVAAALRGCTNCPQLLKKVKEACRAQSQLLLYATKLRTPPDSKVPITSSVTHRQTLEDADEWLHDYANDDTIDNTQEVKTKRNDMKTGKPKTNKAEQVAVKAEQVAVKAEQVVVKAEPVAVKAEQVVVKAKPVAVKAEPVAVKAEPLLVKDEYVKDRPAQIAATGALSFAAQLQKELSATGLSIS